MYYGKDVFVCESKSGVLVSGKRIFRLFKGQLSGKLPLFFKFSMVS